MSDPKPGWQRPARARFGTLAAAVLIALGFGLASWVQQVRIAAARTKDL